MALINEAGVRHWFGGQDPVGRRVVSGTTREIVGVVGDVPQRSLGDPAAPQLFVPYAQRSTRSLRFVVRGAGEFGSQVAAVRAAVRSVDPNLPLTDVTPLGDVITRLAGADAVLHGAPGDLCRRRPGAGRDGRVRRHELCREPAVAGTRHPPGARRAAGWRSLGLVVRQSLRLTTAGLVAGLAGAVLLARAGPAATLRGHATRSADAAVVAIARAHRNGGEPRAGAPRRATRPGAVVCSGRVNWQPRPAAGADGGTMSSWPRPRARGP